MIKMTFEVITPVLLRRGAVEVEDPRRRGKTIAYYYSDISGQTFRGLLRWWFRFLTLQKFDPGEVLRLEKFLFGSSGEEGIGASPIAIIPKVDKDAIKSWTGYADKLPGYFKGFRFDPRRKTFKIISPGRNIEVYLIWQMILGNLIKDEKKVIEKYENVKGVIFEIYILLLAAISVCGGIGAAWRRGLGSIQLVKCEAPRMRDCVKDIVERIINGEFLRSEESFKRMLSDIREKVTELFKEVERKIRIVYSSLQSSTTAFLPCLCGEGSLLVKIGSIKRDWKEALKSVTYNTRGSFLSTLRLQIKRDPKTRVIAGYPLIIRGRNAARDNASINYAKKELERALKEEAFSVERIEIDRIPSPVIISVKKLNEGYMGTVILSKYCKILPKDWRETLSKLEGIIKNIPII